ncbi:hypothetical protein, variant [Cryptococcus amylolentus CBS 6039]|uniref:PRELI/MSF1 domain-containing protein n=1 Tax=Cryptococcus amylolentus CBS 6039 TaxID=1295533 RepID=A0A1E3I4U9_9TREE|nr:hypothetical protein, variant [Cryptococcus amylolentus CBS 6039]ODN83517.1 hypothetical protein, variant [Cryptococcus amylolentus CBS 6039]
MVQVYKKTHSYPEPPATSLLAFFLRYPNPFARHVLSVDVLDRTVDPVTGRIHTTRLILKRGILPKWATRWLPSSATSGGSGLDAWIYEESIVDPPGWGEGRTDLGAEGEDFGKQPRLRMQQGNLNHRKAMHVIEGGDLRAGPNGTTLHHTTAEVRSDLGGAWSSLIRKRIESYGLGKFEGNSETVGCSYMYGARADQRIVTERHVPHLATAASPPSLARDCRIRILSTAAAGL